MKRLYIVVEGQTEQEFVNTLLRPWLNGYSIFDITPILIKTSKYGRGGLLNSRHLINTINGLLKESNDEQLIVSSFIDFFRIPGSMPGYEEAMKFNNSISQVNALESALGDYIGDKRFIPYIQRHEFEALLFSSNAGFEKYCNKKESSSTSIIVEKYDNPEDINSSPETSPSKRLLAIIPNYDKVILGNILALEVGMETILQRCPRFAEWVRTLIDRCK